MVDQNDSSRMAHPSLSMAKGVGQRVVASFGDDELMTRAAALAFYSALSFAPLLVLLLWILASLNPEWQRDMVSGLMDLVGPRAADGVELVIDNASERPGIGSLAGWISLGVTLVGASAVFAQLQFAINRVWGLRPEPGRAVFGWVRSRVQAVGLLLTLALLLIMSFVASALIALVVGGETIVWRVLEAALSFLVFTFVFSALFRVLPDAQIHKRDALVGGAITAVLFAFGKYMIGLYLDRSEVGGAYGPAAGVVVLLVWVYFSALILLVGAKLTQAIAEVRGRPILPDKHAIREAAGTADAERE